MVWRVFLQACAPLKLHVILIAYVGLVSAAIPMFIVVEAKRCGMVALCCGVFFSRPVPH